jgi:hypothetical protein
MRLLMGLRSLLRPPLLDPALDRSRELLDLLGIELAFVERSELLGIGSLDPSGDSIHVARELRDRDPIPGLDRVSRTELDL